MNKHIQPLYKIVAFGFAFVGFSAAAQNCPDNIPSTPMPFICDSNPGNGTILSPHNNTQLTIKGPTSAPALTINKTTTSTSNGVGVYRRSGGRYVAVGNVSVTTNGHVTIEPENNSPGVPDGIIIVGANRATVNLSKDTKIVTDQGPQNFWNPDAADGVVVDTRLTTDQIINITSEASITTKKPYSNGIIAKYAKTIDLKINQNGQITTEQTNSPAINSSPGGNANSIVTLTNAQITTRQSKSVGVIYKSGIPILPFTHGDRVASKNNSLIELTDNSSITTTGAQAHAIAAGAGGDVGKKNHVNLTDSRLHLTGAGAHGVYLNTRVNDQGQDTAQVTMQGGSITSTLGDGIHFIDSVNANPNPIDQGTTGSVTLSDSAATGSAGYATIDAPNGNAIFTARGSDRVTLKNNTRIIGMVDGGDDAASLPDQWVDVLTFDDYDSIQQLVYTSALVQYQNFENVKLQNKTKIQFPSNYSTPPSETYQIDSTSSIGKYIIGPTSTYTINATLTNDGTINLQDGTGGTVGDTLTVTGNAGGNGKFLFDIDATTGTADTLTINGDYTGNVKIGLNDVVTTADPTQIIDLVIIKGTNKGGPVTLEPNTTPTTTPTTHTVGGVTYSLFSYEKNGAKIWALKVIPPTPAAKIPTLSAYGLLLLLLSMCLTVTRYFRNH